MTPAEEFAALIEEAKEELAMFDEHDRQTNPICKLLRATIATWELINHAKIISAKIPIGGVVPIESLCNVAIAATKERKP